MIGVTIGIGEGWRECAKNTATRMEKMTGIACCVIDSEPLHKEGVHPSWFKHVIVQMFSHSDDFLYFDADIFPMKPWNPEQLFRESARSICVVHDNDPVMAAQVRAEELAIGIPPGTYINAGLFMFGREHVAIFDEVWSMRPSFHRWIDQSAFNYVLNKHKVSTRILPDKYNQLRPDGRIRGTEDINSHLCGLGGNWHMLWRMQEMIFNQAAACNPQPTSALPTIASPKVTGRQPAESTQPLHPPGQAS